MREKQYVGIDLHRKYMTITSLDTEGRVQENNKILNSDTSRLINTFSNGQIEYNVVVESTYGWYWLADIVDKLPNVNLKLAHAKKVKALTSGNKKTDKIDAELLANLDRCNLLPESHKSSQLSREVKEILRYRSTMISKRADLKNRIRDIIAKNNFYPRISDIASLKGRKWLSENITKYPYKLQVDSLLEVMDSIDKQVNIVDKQLYEYVDFSEDVKLLKTIPGIGNIIALTLLAEIDDISRFPNENKLCAYAGLVPSVSSSGGKTYMGRVMKANKYIKPALAQAVVHTVKRDPWLKAKYEKLKESKNTGTAKVAIMRKIMVSVFYVLTRQEPYKFRKVSDE